MYAVGIRELKARLSDYLRRVRAGETVLVTDRGRVVAELGPPRVQALPDDELAALDDLVRSGDLRRGAPHDPAGYERSPRRASPAFSAELLDWLRAERTADSGSEGEGEREGGGEETRR